MDYKELSEKLSRLKTYEELQEIYYELNYDFVDHEPYPTTNWAQSAQKITNSIGIIARKGDFKVFHVDIEKLTKTNERKIINALRKTESQFVVFFTSPNNEETHLVNPLFLSQQTDETIDPNSNIVLQRYVFGTGEPMRTASERLMLIKLNEGENWLVAKQKHDEAFSVEAVTERFYKDYKTFHEKIKESLRKQKIKGVSEKEINEFSLQFLNRLMFLYFVQKKGWLLSDKRFIANLLKKFKQEKTDNFYEKWLSPLFFYGFNNKTPPKSISIHSYVKGILSQIPYLNGGLFRKNYLDEIGFHLSDNIIIQVIEKFLEKYNFTVSEDTPFDQEVAVDPEMLGKVYESLIGEEERGKSGIFYTPRIEVDFMCRLSLFQYLININILSREESIRFVFAPEISIKELEEYKKEKIHDALLECKIVDPACGSGAFLVSMANLLYQIQKVLNPKIDELTLRKTIIRDNIYGVDVKAWAIQMSELRLWLWLIEKEEKRPENKNYPFLPNIDLKLRVGDSLLSSVFTSKEKTVIKRNTARYRLTKKINTLIKLKEELRNLMKLADSKQSEDLQQQLKNLLLIIQETIGGDKKTTQLEMYSEDNKRSREEILLEALEKQIKDTENKLKERNTEDFTKIKSLVQELSKLKHDYYSSLTNKRDILNLIMNKEKQILNYIIKDNDPSIADFIEENVTINAQQINREQLFIWELDFAEVFGLKGGFDIVIGNPPYIKKEKIIPPLSNYFLHDISSPQDYKNSIEKMIKLNFPSCKLPNKQSDYYVYFYYLGLSILNQKGVMVLITSNTWLDTKFGATLQEFLLKNSKLFGIIDNLAERTFSSAEINTVIVFVSHKEENDTDLSKLTTKFVSLRAPYFKIIKIDELLSLFKNYGKERIITTTQWRLIEKSQLSIIKTMSDEIKNISPQQLNKIKYKNYKLGGYFLYAPDIFHTILEKIEKKNRKIIRLGDIATVNEGRPTGSNKFFFITKEIIEKYNIEQEFLRPGLMKTRNKSYYIIDQNLIDRYFLEIPTTNLKSLSTKNVYNYIKFVEKNVVPKSKTLKQKKYWWYFSPRIPADLICPTGYGETFFCAINKVQAICSNSYTEIRINRKNYLYTIFYFLNSSVGWLLLEVLGKKGLGGGMLKVDPIELRKLPILDISLNEIIPITNKKIKSIFEECGFNKNLPIREQKPLPLEPRRSIDNLIFDILELTDKERLEVYWSLCEMVKQRNEKAKSLKSRR